MLHFACVETVVSNSVDCLELCLKLCEFKLYIFQLM